MGSYTPSIRRIGIIGAGPTGVVFAKFLLAEKVFDRIDIWEQRDRVGGVWNLSDPTRTKWIPIPQTNPRYGQQSVGKSSDTTALEDSLELESPLYDYLETNIPKSMMQYSEKPFADDDPLFPSHQRVLDYLQEYSTDVQHLIHFEHQVVNVQRQADEWLLQVRNDQSGSFESHTYDAVVVANGHYTIPSIPMIKGLKSWNTAYPDTVIHSKAYRKPEDFSMQKVLVIGNSASGLDIAHQVAQKARQPVVLSARSVSQLSSGTSPEWREDINEVVEFLPSSSHNRAVRCASGHIEEDIDAVIFCTGYFYSFPFLSDLRPPITTDGLRTNDVYRDLVHIEYPSLVFPVINLKVIPFPLAENQAAVTARIWSGRLELPSKEEMRRWEAQTMESNGKGKYFHLKKFPDDCAQINDLFDWAMEANPVAGLENEGKGKLGARWSKELVWLRSQFPAIKGAYIGRGEERVKVKDAGQLGFDFEQWLQTATDQDLTMFRKALC